MKIILVGKLYIKDKVDITDPCYEKNVWCRINDIHVKPGYYDCWVTMLDPLETNGWGHRVKSIKIEMPDECLKEKTVKMIGDVGVDSGMAGFFIDKPDCIDDLYEKIDRKNKSYWLWEDSFFSNAGYGDGLYSVDATYNDRGECIGLSITYIGDE